MEWWSIRLMFASMKRSSWSKARIIADPASDSAKWWRIGALWIPAKRASSLAVGVESKNAIGALSTLCSMFVNSFSAVESPAIATSMARTSTQSELPTASRT